MKTLEIRQLNFLQEYPGLDAISTELDNAGPPEPLDIINWKEFSYKPEAGFKMAFTDREILLKYYIREHCTKAEMTEPNQPVWEDSCVEFFVSPADDGIYYNLEMNPVGTCLLGTGTGRSERTRADSAIIRKIRTKSSLGTAPFSEKKIDGMWSLTVAIPLDVLYLHNIGNLHGMEFRANFYKCGDRLSMPHYLSWNRIMTAKPDFHKPDFFGKIMFI